MRLQNILTAVGAALCSIGAILFWPVRLSCGIPAFMLLTMFLLGVAGFFVVIFDQKQENVNRVRALWVICGILLSLTIIGVLTVAPFSLLSLFFLSIAALLRHTLISVEMLKNIGIFALCAIVSFGLFFSAVIEMGSEVVDLPPASLAGHGFPEPDFAHGNRVPLPAGHISEITAMTRMVFTNLSPCWAEPFHRSAKDDNLLQHISFRKGSFFGGWEIIEKTDNEIVLEEKDSHLNFRVSVLLSETGGVHYVTVTTIVHFNNWKGFVYFIPVGLAHQILMADGMRKLAYQIRLD